MANWRNYAHVVEVSFSDYVLRCVQTIVALALLVLTLWTIVFNDYASVRLSVFASAFDLAILAYYLISVHGLPFIYNYAAIIVTEFLILAFWTATFSSLAALYTDHKNTDLLYTNAVISAIAISAFAFVLHLITLGMILRGVAKHRKAGKPLFSPQGRRPTTDHAADTLETRQF